MTFYFYSDIEIKYYKKYLSRISFTGLSETILEEKINEESEEELEEILIESHEHEPEMTWKSHYQIDQKY